MKIDKTKPVIRWAVVCNPQEAAKLVQVEDIMRCIEKPGDFGWVQATDGSEHFIAEYEQLSETREGAKRKFVDQSNKAFEAARQVLAEAEAL
jgi:hypothetical protein